MSPQACQSKGVAWTIFKHTLQKSGVRNVPSTRMLKGFISPERVGIISPFENVAPTDSENVPLTM